MVIITLDKHFLKRVKNILGTTKKKKNTVVNADRTALEVNCQPLKVGSFLIHSFTENRCATFHSLSLTVFPLNLHVYAFAYIPFFIYTRHSFFLPFLWFSIIPFMPLFIHRKVSLHICCSLASAEGAED